MIKNNSFFQQISKIISPDSGTNSPLSDDDKRFVTEYEKMLIELSPDDQLLIFRNVLRKEGHCGYMGGENEYLVNTDSGNDYRVTVRTFMRQGGNSGQYDETHFIAAGARELLGCTITNSFPTTVITREIVGESK